MIEVVKLVKRFGSKTVLKGLDFVASQGEFVVLMGPNGSGKTTFLRILSSLSRPTAGKVSVGGYRLPEQADGVRPRLGVVTHLPLLYGNLTAEENLRFYGRLYRVKNPGIRIGEILELVGLASRGRDLVRTYSRGMQQRLAIGRAVLHDPEVLLLDEPYTGLDQAGCDMLDQFLRVAIENKKTVLMASHEPDRVGHLASRFDVLRDGVISVSLRQEDLAKADARLFYRKALEGDR